MKRDNDLIRKLMLELEVANRVVTADLEVDGYERNQIAYHLSLIVKTNLADGNVSYYMGNEDPTVPGAVMALRLTPAGHDFIDTIRDDRVWSKTKETVAKVGGSVSVDLLKQVAGSAAKAMLGLTV